MKRSFLPLALLALPLTLSAEESSAIPLAGTWQVAITAPVSREQNAGVAADPGISVAAKQIAGGQDPAPEQIQSRTVPMSWTGYGDPWTKFDGEAVFWRTFEVPSPGNQPWELSLSSIDDFDTTWINGEIVGSTDKSRPGHWAFRRVYTVPPGLLKAGPNRIVVRVFDQMGDGGFSGRPKELCLKPKVTK